MLPKSVFELTLTEKNAFSRTVHRATLTVQIDQLIEISKDTVEFDRTHARGTFHRLAKTFLHDFQAFQMCAFGVNQFVDRGLQFPFSRLIQRLENIRRNEITQVRQRIDIGLEIAIVFRS